MTDATVKRTPEFGAVWSEQLHITGLCLRREAVLAVTALGLFCLVGVALARVPALSALIGDELANVVLDPGDPGPGLVGVFTALLFPLLVWKGERPWGDTPIWSFPVDHRRHALTKVAAGWVWLMALLGGALLCLVLAVAAGGGTLGVDEVRQLILDDTGFFAGEAGATREVAWTTPWWEWVLPFTSATAAYMLASALILATPHPFRWAAAIYVLSLLPMLAVELFELHSLQRGAETFAWFIGGEDFARGARLPTGERVEGWLLLPSIGQWLAWAAVWISLGFASILTASARVRDH